MAQKILVEEDQFADFDQDFTSTLPPVDSLEETAVPSRGDVCSGDVPPTSAGRFSVTNSSDDALSHGGIVLMTADDTLSDC